MGVKEKLRAWNTRRLNKKFSRMSPAEKRVCVARDVLAQLKAKKILAKSRLWARRHDSHNELLSEGDADESTELRDVLPKIEQCDACALGSIFLCAVNRADKLTVGDAGGGRYGLTIFFSYIDTYLEKFFSAGQLRLIEIAYECGRGQFNADTPEQVTAANCYKGLGLEERMGAIMKNIIKNKGQFVPVPQ